jgi:hypothetical protein
MSWFTDTVRKALLPIAWGQLQSKFDRVVLRELPNGCPDLDATSKRVAAACVAELKAALKF